jgi:hypothetical protein
VGRFRFHFYSDEKGEPPQLHVRSPDGECTFWLDPIGLAKTRGIPPHDLRDIERIVFAHQPMRLEAYHAYHGE